MKIKLNFESILDDKIVIEKLKMVLFKSMNKMLNIAVRLAPFDKGLLRQKINLSPQTPGFTSYTLSANVEYAEAVEFGTSPHVIRIISKKVLADVKAGKIFGTRVQHPGTEAQPYFRPALDQVKNIYLKRYIEREFK